MQILLQKYENGSQTENYPTIVLTASTHKNKFLHIFFINQFNVSFYAESSIVVPSRHCLLTELVNHVLDLASFNNFHVCNKGMNGPWIWNINIPGQKWLKHSGRNGGNLNQYKDVVLHYNDIIMSRMASQITSLTIVYSTVYFFKAKIKENIKAPRHWPLCGEFTVTGKFHAQRASNAENVSIWCRHHDQYRDSHCEMKMVYKIVLSPQWEFLYW